MRSKFYLTQDSHLYDPLKGLNKFLDQTDYLGRSCDHNTFIQPWTPIVNFWVFWVSTYRRYVSQQQSGTAPISLEGASRLLNDVGACSGDNLAGEGPRGPIFTDSAPFASYGQKTFKFQKF